LLLLLIVATLQIEVRSKVGPIAGATVIVNGSTYTTAADGLVTVIVEAGPAEITAVKDGFLPVTASVSVQEGQTQAVVIDLHESPTVEEEVTVSATRTGKRLDDQPMRVEVLQREEIEEKMLMTPGDIVMMLNEMGGMRVQATSPSLGAASVRIQGMSGRYTRFFSDGLPLFGEVGGLGLLQIPPMDLGQVEVIKGVASSLYGAGAMGGVVNLLSRRPARRGSRELLLNRSTRGATDAVAWYATPARPGWAVTLLGGGIGRNRTMSTTTRGWTYRVIRAPSCGRECSGMEATAARFSRRRGSRRRTARAAVHQRVFRTSRRWIRGELTRVQSVSC
jgi:iron complex outermembrane receptor protein